MKKEVANKMEDELRPEYDIAQMKGAIRGKYVERYRQGTNLVLLEPDIAQAFPTDEAVNEALRLLVKVAKRQLLDTAAQEATQDSSSTIAVKTDDSDSTN
ncbi:hypothetical protein [Vasconcelosia minhoensis]|uniref:hypothetical protein n=1 Tax=Vasconcelosia minhoensis TaxID=3366354 RepID=UPI001D148004|nr:hypothetical protein [Romeria gracilis]